MTKKYKTNYILCKTLSILMTLIPLVIYTIKGFCEGTPGSKVTLGVCFTTALTLTISYEKYYLDTNDRFICSSR